LAAKRFFRQNEQNLQNVQNPKNANHSVNFVNSVLSFLMATVRIDDSQLQAKIAQWSLLTGRTVEQETRTALKGMVRDAIAYTPPGSQGASGSAAKKQGEGAILRDLSRMGFIPVKIKGKKVYNTTFWGHKLSHPPLNIPTKLNPKFADPEGFRKSRLANKHGRTVTRGGAQAFYVDQKLFNPMRQRLIQEVGRLASGWVNAANQLGVPVPAWISRHSETFARGTPVIIEKVNDKLTMRVTNRFPEGTEQSGIAADMIRRIDSLRVLALNRLQRQIDYGLKNGLRQAR
jgi:hypothetical protein